MGERVRHDVTLCPTLQAVVANCRLHGGLDVASFEKLPLLVRVPRPDPCPFRKSYPDVLMMQSGQDRNGDNDTRPLDCSMQGRIFL